MNQPIITVSIVDDHPTILRLVMDLIDEASDLRCVSAHEDGREAISVLASIQPDVVLMDVTLPGASGVTCVRELRLLCPKTKFVMLTVHDDVDYVQEALDAGASGYVVKPHMHWAALNVVRLAHYQYACFPSSALEALINGTPKMESSIPREGDAKMCRGDDVISTALAEVVGGFCHDLGNLFSALHGEFGSGKLKGKRQTRSLKLIQAAEKSVNLLHSVVKDFYKDSPSAKLWLKSTEARSALENDLSGTFDERLVGVTVSLRGFSSDQLLPYILLRHLVLPLASNAAEAMQEYDVKDKGQINVILESFEDSNGVRIQVTDNGPGWSSILEKLQAKLQQEEPFSTKGKKRGYGLLNVNRILKKLGGQIRLSNCPSGGAEVEIRVEWKSPNAKTKND